MENCCQKTRRTERNQEELKALKARINRLVGQMKGISKMLDENRYCGDILNQIAAIEKALKSVGYLILKTHMNTCVKESVLEGKDEAIDEVFEIIKRLQ